MINREDLLALVNAATLGWVHPSPDEEPPLSAAALHSRFVDLVHRASPSARGASDLRRQLLTEINEVSTELLVQAKKAVRRLEGASFSVDLLQPDGSFAPTTTPARDVPPFADADAVLTFSQEVQKLPFRAQTHVNVGLELFMKGEMRRADVQIAESIGNAADVVAERQALSAHLRLQQAFEDTAPPVALEFLRSHQRVVWPFAWGTWTVPVLVPATAEDRELVEAAAQYEQMRKAMFRPLPLSDNGSRARLRRDRRNWRAYESCGDSFGVLGAWLRAIAATGTARRCQVCYRHLAPGLKRFCEEHLRNAITRQNSRDLHISTVYRPLVRWRSSERLTAVTDLMRWRPAGNELEALIAEAQAAGIRKELAKPAAALAASLRALYPAMTQPVMDRVQSVFVQLFTLAQEPFEWDAPRTMEGHGVRERARREAPHLLRLETFLEAFFGPSTDLDWPSQRQLGAGLDPRHPAARGMSVSPDRLAVDLLHLSSWLDVDAVFDKFAYVDPLQLSRMRAGNPSTGARPMSLAAISKSVGISPEAVRKTLRYADGLAGLAERRPRVIPAGLRALKEHLCLEDRTRMRARSVVR